MLPNNLESNYDEFSKAVQNNKILDSKTTTMLYLASSIAVGCYPWTEYFLGVAEAKGITNEEIGIIQGIVMAVSGGRVRAQFKEIRARVHARKNKETK